MKKNHFFVSLFFIFFFNIQSLKADETKMTKGLEIFNEIAGCAGCHVLKAAGAEGNVGPSLDSLKPTEAEVQDMVFYGLGVMPAYGEDEMLTKEQVDIVSYYVANSAGK
jgi:mono/diheme cytochrome c family protein